ncbi:MAG: hypothetical protein DI570_15190 [Phenylobacterium zucineum]|nr:MAG: hypothetical protein DI570_15190 [Phenylobacterium zucineum]
MPKPLQSNGREDNAAQPPGELPGLKTREGRDATATRSRRAAGPDGPDAGVVGRTFKAKPS